MIAKEERVLNEPSRRLNLNNLDTDVCDYLEGKSSEETKKSTAFAVCLYNEIMSSYCETTNEVFTTLAQTDL